MDLPTDQSQCLPRSDAVSLAGTSTKQSIHTFVVPDFPIIPNHDTSFLPRPSANTSSPCLPLPTPINNVVLVPNIKRSNNIILIQPELPRTCFRAAPSTPEPVCDGPDSIGERSSVTDTTSETLDDADIIVWMKENFRADPASLLSREHVYESYKTFATEKGKTIMNPACLGKAMRKIFPGMKTRRLGKRGDSKYHYSGVDTVSRENPNTTASRLPLQRKRRSAPHSPVETRQKSKSSSFTTSETPIICPSQLVPPRKKRKIKSAVILDKEIVKWLQRNFRSNPVSVIPRDFVFHKYREYCEKLNKTDTNAACFGKTLRGVFPNMETRRLGSRGSSKYHYAGIEVHPNGDYEESHPFFKMARRQKFRSTSVSSTDAAAQVPSIPAELSIPNISPESPPHNCNEPTEEHIHAINVVEVLQRLIDSIPSTNPANHICPSLRKKSSWADLTSSHRDAKMNQGSDFDCFFWHFRVHIGMLAQCFLSGALLGMPEIIENFWVTRKQSLQVPEKNQQTAFDAIINECWVQNIVRDSYLHLYDTLVWRLMSSPCSVMPSSLAYVLIDFLHKFPFWIRHITRSMKSSDMRAIVCHTAAAFSVQLEKLSRISELEEKLKSADAVRRSEFSQDCVVVLSHVLSETSSKFNTLDVEQTNDDVDMAKSSITLANYLLESATDLTKFHSHITPSLQTSYAKLENEFIGGRLVKEKSMVLDNLQSKWTSIIAQYDTEKSYSKYVTTSWKIFVNIFTEKERVLIEKKLPIVAAFTPIAERLGTQIPEVVSTEDLAVSLPYFSQNNIKDLHFLTRPDNLSFYLRNPELQQCLSTSGEIIEADLDS